MCFHPRKTIIKQNIRVQSYCRLIFYVICYISSVSKTTYQLMFVSINACLICLYICLGLINLIFLEKQLFSKKYGFKVITGGFFMLFGLQFQKQLTNWCLIASMLVSKKITTTKRMTIVMVITAAKIFVLFDSVISKKT